jgi:restriction endonuclease S subunit
MSHRAAQERKWSAYPAYKPSGVEWLGHVPEHWEAVSLRRLLRVSSGDMISVSDFREEGYPVYGGNGFRGYADRWNTEGNTIIIGRYGALCGNVRVTEKRIWATEHAFRVIPLVSFYPTFLAAVIETLDLNRLSARTAQPGLNSEMVRNNIVGIPPISEQKAIAAFLDRETARIDALIEKKRRQIELLQEKRSALISHAVTKGLDPNAPMKDSGIEWLGQIPKHWEAKRLRFLVSEPLKYGANESAELDDPDLPRYIRITDVNENGRLRDETFKSLPEDVARPYLLKEGDLLLARSGATVGKSFYYEASWGRAAYAGYLIRARFNPARMMPRFVNYFTNSEQYWQWLASSFIQATIQNVSAEKYANLVVPVPPVDEQAKIIAYLDGMWNRLNALMDKVATSIEQLQEYRSALISAAVTGKIDVRGEVA